MLKPYLDDLECRIDEAQEEELLHTWVEFASGRYTGALFVPARHKTAPASLAWPHVNINDALEDFDLMALRELRTASQFLAEGSGKLLCARANYGTSILPSLFGAALFIMPRDADTLPTNYPLPTAAETLEAYVQAGAPRPEGGLATRVFGFAAHLRDLLRPYPKLSKYLYLYHPDLQGPLDICELLWGSRLFYDLYDRPELVHDVLDTLTDAYESFLDAWLAEYPSTAPRGYSVHWGLLHKGTVMLRDDSAMNLSPAMYEEFALPRDQRLLGKYSGAMHFCGRGDHYIRALSESCGLTAINLTQPEYNNMDVIYDATIERGLPLLDLNREEANAALHRRGTLRSLVQTVA